MTHPPDPRWDQLLAAARRSAPRDDAAPPAFATRVIARWRSLPPAPSLALLWHRLTLRALGFAFAILLAGLATTILSAENDPLNPGVADEVGEAFWLR